jgi:hypothetical protein
MARPTIEDKPLDTKVRRERSNESKVKRGERRLNNWISPEANVALSELTDGDESRGVIKTAVETALINEAKRRRGDPIEEAVKA